MFIVTEYAALNIDCCTDNFFPTCTCTSADVYRICGISYMYMYRAAVHSLDAEFTVLEMTTSNAFFSRELKILYHFKHASILPAYRTRLTFSALVASCVFGFSLEPDQTDNMNFVTIWHSGGILDYVLKY